MLHAGLDRYGPSTPEDTNIFSAVVKSSTPFHASPRGGQAIPVYAQAGAHEGTMVLPDRFKRRWLSRIVIGVITMAAVLASLPLFHSHGYCGDQSLVPGPICELYREHVQLVLRPAAHMYNHHAHPQLQSAYHCARSVSHLAYEAVRDALEWVYDRYIDPKQQSFVSHETREKFQKAVDWLEKTSLREAAEWAQEYMSAWMLDLQHEWHAFYNAHLDSMVHPLVERVKTLDLHIYEQLQHKSDTFPQRVLHALLSVTHSTFLSLKVKEELGMDDREAVDTARHIVESCVQEIEDDSLHIDIRSEASVSLGSDSPLDESGEASLTMAAQDIQDILTLARQSRLGLEAQIGAVKEAVAHDFERLSGHKAVQLAEALKLEIQKLKFRAELRIRDRVQEALSRAKKAECRAWQRDRMVEDIRASQKSALKAVRHRLDLLVLQSNAYFDQCAAQQAQAPDVSSQSVVAGLDQDNEVVY